MDQRLEIFLTVCATMNYRKAAEQLHLTQPAVTKQIQALEALYGVRLFTYDSRKLKKTPQGETLEIYAISQRYQDEELRRALKRQEKTSLRIGATKSIGDYILLPQIIRFLKEPDNELFFTVDNKAHLLAQLEGGELDFVVSVNGRSWKIMRGVEVRVPECVAEVLENARMMAEEARRYVDERAS